VEIEATEHVREVTEGVRHESLDGCCRIAKDPGAPVRTGAPVVSASGLAPVGAQRSGAGTAPRRPDGIRPMATRGRSAREASAFLSHPVTTVRTYVRRRAAAGVERGAAPGGDRRGQPPVHPGR